MIFMFLLIKPAGENFKQHCKKRNSIYSRRERGKIDIELSQNELYAIIKVSDNGVGIPETMKEKVFTPNFTTKSSGTGLGLAISANMIESMNGRLYFVSPNSKEGTDFFIELPLVRNSAHGSEENQVELD